MALGSSLKAFRASLTLRRSRLIKPLSKAAKQAELQVPPYFLCPIHLDVMLDPVTLCTGLTYDRSSIEKWLRTGHNTCPATNQVLQNQDLVPNDTLRHTIKAWCEANKLQLRIPTRVDPETVSEILRSIAQRDTSVGVSLKRISEIAKDFESNREYIKDAGGIAILAGALAHSTTNELLYVDAISILSLLPLDDEDIKVLVANRATLSTIFSVLASGSASLDAKVSAAEVIYTVCGEGPMLKELVDDCPEAVKALLNLLREDAILPRPNSVEAVLKCLLAISIPKKNRVKLIECRAISVLVELIPKVGTRNVEHSFAVLEVLANCAEGREAISNHSSAIVTIVDSMVGVSYQTTDHAVAALGQVLSLASNRTVINTALRAGAFTKLLMLLPSDYSQRSKKKARETLKLLNEVWGSYTFRANVDSGIVIHRRDRIKQWSLFSAES
ncbi:E3 ubiquitin-protein ligase PUB23 [Physcomitrium patens]|uniref:RING-type E3 ubiquitin transferase n=1 Tax=Physcomitrium patens TaxID=3218 RepID=A0A2K1KMF2_PHYPA|nr:E3 ubiquitin-protein ligase PUB23-like [Physcomitrium patens]PNR54953.1 hypothetical protein PHYPA_005846 [Physcomitrium patens]|eukprot:XP_024374795.1 E3 ubiquitin-protein ligase PUB23-like [Physcomitrella patens]